MNIEIPTYEEFCRARAKEGMSTYNMSLALG
jgi:hypothetical protein